MNCIFRQYMLYKKTGGDFVLNKLNANILDANLTHVYVYATCILEILGLLVIVFISLFGETHGP